MTRLTTTNFHPVAQFVLGDTGPISVGIILGSGLEVLEALGSRHDIPYRDIPNFPETGVAGHRGILSIGSLPEGPRVAVARGRFHLYEGHDEVSARYLVELLAATGVRTLILTNAAGGLREDWFPGDLMLIEDHLNLTGRCVVVPRSVFNASRAYDLELQVLALASASQLGILLRRGCYAGLLGPSYETAAEIRYLVRAGADAVGMSTVLEATAAADLGMRVLGLSCITNVAVSSAGLGGTSHDEVVAVANRASKHLDRLLQAICVGCD